VPPGNRRRLTQKGDTMNDLPKVVNGAQLAAPTTTAHGATAVTASFDIVGNGVDGQLLFSISQTFGANVKGAVTVEQSDDDSSFSTATQFGTSGVIIAAQRATGYHLYAIDPRTLGTKRYLRLSMTVSNGTVETVIWSATALYAKKYLS